MITRIGLTAGEIWSYLEKQEESTMNHIIEVLNKDRDEILMSIGWLAREGHILLAGKSPDHRISLAPMVEK